MLFQSKGKLNSKERFIVVTAILPRAQLSHRSNARSSRRTHFERNSSHVVDAVKPLAGADFIAR